VSPKPVPNIRRSSSRPMRTLQTPGFKPFPAPQAIPPDGTALLSREVLSGVGHGNKKPPICGRFCFRKEPSDGLEPSTPSLPGRCRGGTGVHARALAARFSCKSASRSVSVMSAFDGACSTCCTRLVPAFRCQFSKQKTCISAVVSSPVWRGIESGSLYSPSLDGKRTPGCRGSLRGCMSASGRRNLRSRLAAVGSRNERVDGVLRFG
jgi:hypothetical protein